MRRYGLYDATRGLTLALAAALAGLLLYLATQVGQQTTVRFWEEMGIVAGAGLVLALAPVLGGWSSGLRLRLSPGTFLLGFIPVLVVVGWILMATQPGHGWHEGTIVRWSHDIGLMGLIHDLGLWHGVLAFGFGLVLGTTMDAVPVVVEEPMSAPASATQPMPVAEEPVTRTRRPWYRRRSQFADDADAPTTAESRAQQRVAARRAEPPMVPVGRTTDDVEE
jgi:biotin transporter BioY